MIFIDCLASHFIIISTLVNLLMRAMLDANTPTLHYWWKQTEPTLFEYKTYKSLMQFKLLDHTHEVVYTTLWTWSKQLTTKFTQLTMTPTKLSQAKLNISSRSKYLPWTVESGQAHNVSVKKPNLSFKVKLNHTWVWK